MDMMGWFWLIKKRLIAVRLLFVTLLLALLRNDSCGPNLNNRHLENGTNYQPVQVYELESCPRKIFHATLSTCHPLRVPTFDSFGETKLRMKMKGMFSRKQPDMDKDLIARLPVPNQVFSSPAQEKEGSSAFLTAWGNPERQKCLKFTDVLEYLQKSLSLVLYSFVLCLPRQMMKRLLAFVCHFLNLETDVPKLCPFLREQAERICACRIFSLKTTRKEVKVEGTGDENIIKSSITSVRRKTKAMGKLIAKNFIYSNIRSKTFDCFNAVPFLPSLPQYYHVYPLFEEQIQRLASYKNLLQHRRGHSVHFSPITLSEAGFCYTGTDEILQCTGCQNKVTITDFSSNPTDCQYHREGCQFLVKKDESNATASASTERVSIKDDCLNPEENGQSNNDDDQIEPSTSSLTTRPNGHPAHPEYSTNQAAHPHFNTYLARLVSFSDMEATHSHRPEDLADAGFFYAGYSDCVRCFHCGLGLRSWKPRDNIYLQHERNRPSCSLIQMQMRAMRGNADQSEAAVPITEGIAEPGCFWRSTPSTSPSGNSTGYSKTPADSGILDDDINEPECNLQSNDKAIASQGHFKTSCQKNVGHDGYSTMSACSVKPTKFYAFLQQCAALTVKVTVRITSKQRPKNDPVTEHLPQGKRRTGTGSAFGDHAELPIPSVPEKRTAKWKSLKNHLFHTTKEKQGVIFIETNRHLVYNDEEAEATSVDFFYNTSNKKGVVSVKGHSVFYSNLVGSTKVILICKTNKMQLVEKVKKLQQKLRSSLNNLPQNVKRGLLSRVFVISHPHGAEKVFSYGESVVIKYLLAMDQRLVKIRKGQEGNHPIERLRKILVYNANTCEGSVGAPVITFKKCENDSNNKDFIQLVMWMHNGVNTTLDLNGSVMEACSEADLIEEEGPDPKENIDSSNNKDQSKPTSSPAFTTVGHSAHPRDTTHPKQIIDGVAETEPHYAHRPAGRASEGASPGPAPAAVCRTVLPVLEKEKEKERAAETYMLMCKVCSNVPFDIVFLPCGHLFACKNCTELLTNCPLCRKKIEATVDLFPS